MNLYELDENWKPYRGIPDALEMAIDISNTDEEELKALFLDNPSRIVVIAGASAAIKAVGIPERIYSIVFKPPLINIYNAVTRMVEEIGEKHGIDTITHDNVHTFSAIEREIIATRLGFIKMCLDHNLLSREELGEAAEEAERIVMEATTVMLTRGKDVNLN